MNIILLLQLMRVKQWVKNMFVIVPVFFSGTFATQNIIEVIISFTAFSLLTSAIYILNDWCDIESDKQHAKKKSRPLASGAVSTNAALFLFITLLTTLAVICVYSNLSLMSVAFSMWKCEVWSASEIATKSNTPSSSIRSDRSLGTNIASSG